MTRQLIDHLLEPHGNQVLLPLPLQRSIWKLNTKDDLLPCKCLLSCAPPLIKTPFLLVLLHDPVDHSCRFSHQGARVPLLISSLMRPALESPVASEFGVISSQRCEHSTLSRKASIQYINTPPILLSARATTKPIFSTHSYPLHCKLEAFRDKPR
jgi:hypothetical protein